MSDKEKMCDCNQGRLPCACKPAEQHQGEPVAWMLQYGPDAGQRFVQLDRPGGPFVDGRQAFPLYSHADAGKLERLRAQLEDQRREFTHAQTIDNHKWAELVGNLRTQLAEQDALLKRQPSFIRALEQFEADDGTFVRLADVLDALSASAEPSANAE